MNSAFERPFPALTAAQRYHLEVFGYVIVNDVLSADECGTLREALQRVKREIRTPGYAERRGPHQPIAEYDLPHHVYMGSVLEADPCLTAYVSHPRIVGMAEELLGAEARLVEFNAHINSRKPNDNGDDRTAHSFHRGIDIPFGSHISNGLYHCSFVKALTNLTDLEPGDGGTVVIAGSHKIEVPEGDSIECAYADPSLIHHVVAPAGSTLLFSETLIHGTGRIRSDRERVVIIAGYGTTMFPYWDGGTMSPEFTASVPEHLKALFLGRVHWTRGERYRQLSEPGDTRRFSLADGWWPDSRKNN